MHWYVSCRTGDSTVMHVLKERELAIAAAWGLIAVLVVRSRSGRCREIRK